MNPLNDEAKAAADVGKCHSNILIKRINVSGLF